MHYRILLLASVFTATLSVPLSAQNPRTNSASSVVGASPTSHDASGPVTLSSSELQQLVAPIALYPDPLLALILPASTYPDDITKAQAWLDAGGVTANISSQPWDANVQGLAHYPDVLKMMASNMDWTNQLGAAVLAQQPAVMAAVQAQRQKAKSVGNLTSNMQQQVVTENNAIQIAPASPYTVYVPEYDPETIYTQPGISIDFGDAFDLGLWCGGGFNWGGGFFYSSGFYNSSFGWSWSSHSWSSSRYVWHRDWHRGGRPHPGYRPGHGGVVPGWHHWHDWQHGHHGDHSWAHHDGNHHGDHRPGFIPGETHHDEHGDHGGDRHDGHHDGDHHDEHHDGDHHESEHHNEHHEPEHHEREHHDFHPEHHNTKHPEHHEEHHAPAHHGGGGGHRR